MLEKYDVMKGLYELYSKLPKKFLIKNKKIKFFDYPHITNEENKFFINIYCKLYDNRKIEQKELDLINKVFEKFLNEILELDTINIVEDEIS